MSVLQAIRYQGGPNPSLLILDQLQLPHRSHYEEIPSSREGWSAIKTMKTRGAPAIAIVAALSLAVELAQRGRDDTDAIMESKFVVDKLEYLVSSRPTAVNLEDAARKLGHVVTTVAEKIGATPDDVRTAYITAAEKMLVDDVQDNEAIGRYGADWILEHAGDFRGSGANIITHCNTGSLATAGYGTALGVIRSLHSDGLLSHAYCTETRPYNQGSRLTAYELAHDKIPFTLITDSMAASLMNTSVAKPGTKIHAIIVGADRVTANGDTANKIGTYSLAVLAKHHGAKFVVAAPRTSIDLTKDTGAEIIIEERSRDEVTLMRGPVVDGSAVLDDVAVVSLAPKDINVWNPAFDITPAGLIDAIVTESGVIERAANGTFPLREYFSV